MSFWRLFYHAVWACEQGKALITAELEPQLYTYLRRKCSQWDAVVYEIGGIEDHLHISFSLAPKYSISEFIGKLKGSSSYWVSHILRCEQSFDWQRGFGVLSFSKRDLDKVNGYVRSQRERHQQNRISLLMETWDEEENSFRSLDDDPGCWERSR